MLILHYSISYQIRELWYYTQHHFFLGSDDNITWKGLSSRSIAYVYKYLIKIQNPFICPWYTRIWKSRSKPKENFLMWKTLNNALHTKDNPMRRSIINVSVCLLCSKSKENVGHLFFSCMYVHNLWKRILHHYHF